MKSFIACCLAAGFLMLASVQVRAAAPCCAITAVDVRTGVVTAHDTATNRTLQFKVPARLLRSLRIGQKVSVDYRTKRVSVNAAAPCCSIINVHPAEPVGEPTTPAQPATDMHPAEPVSEPQATSQAMSSGTSSNPLGSRSGRPPVKAGRGTENPGRGECADRGGEWRCTTIGTDINTGEPLRSCHCINP